MPSEPSYYLGPTSDRWHPTSWSDVVSAAADGLLDESSWVELKADVPPANKASNLETARDLASLTLDGGLYVVGVRDDKGHAGDVVGVADGDSLADRLVQLAAARLAPSLAVRPHVIVNPDDPTRVCLIVAIPATPEAPHMVDNVYWGRSPTGKRPLDDPEVRRLHAARSLRDQAFEHDLVALTQTFEQIPAQSREGHVFMLARPLASIGELPKDFAAAWPQVVSLSTDMPYANWPGLSAATRGLNHPDGPATTSRFANFEPTSEESVAAVLIRDRGHVGEIQAFSGAGTFPQPGEPSMVSAMVMVQLVQQMLMLTDYVGRTQLGTESGWQVGLHVTGLAGSVGESPAPGTPAYPHENLTQTLTVTAAELAEDAIVLVKRLVGPLVRGIGMSWVLDSYTGPETLRFLRGR